MQAVVLSQKDYSVSWKHRGGRPTSQEEFEGLLRAYYQSVDANSPADPRAFLAYTEHQDICEARLLLVAVTGEPLDNSKPVSVRDPLHAGWPDLAAKMAKRELQGVLCQRFVSSAVVKLQGASIPAADTEYLHRLGYYGYVGVNPKFSTPSFSLTMTDPQKEGFAKTSEAAPEVASRLAIPLWVQAAAKL
jgi:hypothetical protein